MAEFDVDGDLVRKLSALLEECGLTELEFTSDNQSIRLSRGGGAAAIPTAAPAPGAPEPATASGSPAGAISAPMVGAVYLAPEPGADPFIRVGDTVSEGQTLLLIEAMKTYNPVRAPRGGKITSILVADGAPVEFGQDLLTLE